MGEFLDEDNSEREKLLCFFNSGMFQVYSAITSIIVVLSFVGFVILIVSDFELILFSQEYKLNIIKIIVIIIYPLLLIAPIGSLMIWIANKQGIMSNIKKGMKWISFGLKVNIWQLYAYYALYSVVSIYLLFKVPGYARFTFIIFFIAMECILGALVYFYSRLAQELKKIVDRAKYVFYGLGETKLYLANARKLRVYTIFSFIIVFFNVLSSILLKNIYQMIYPMSILNVTYISFVVFTAILVLNLFLISKYESIRFINHEIEIEETYSKNRNKELLGKGSILIVALGVISIMVSLVYNGSFLDSATRDLSNSLGFREGFVCKIQYCLYEIEENDKKQIDYDLDKSPNTRYESIYDSVERLVFYKSNNEFVFSNTSIGVTYRDQRIVAFQDYTSKTIVTISLESGEIDLTTTFTTSRTSIFNRAGEYHSKATDNLFYRDFKCNYGNQYNLCDESKQVVDSIIREVKKYLKNANLVTNDFKND